MSICPFLKLYVKVDCFSSDTINSTLQQLILSFNTLLRYLSTSSSGAIANGTDKNLVVVGKSLKVITTASVCLFLPLHDASGLCESWFVHQSYQNIKYISRYVSCAETMRRRRWIAESQNPGSRINKLRHRDSTSGFTGTPCPTLPLPSRTLPPSFSSHFS